MRYSVFVCVIVAFCFCCMLADAADFHYTDKPAFDFSTNGYHDLKHFTASANVPVKLIDGYIGAIWIQDDIPEDETTRTHLRARVEGGHNWSWFGIRAYGRYGRESVMIEKGLYHGGFHIEATLFADKPVNVKMGLGTWAEDRKILEAYHQEVSDHYDGSGLDFGPRAHLHVVHKDASLQSEFLFNRDKSYVSRNFLHFEIPVAKIAVSEVAIAGTLGVHYDSNVHHVEIDPIQWHWAHALRWRF